MELEASSSSRKLKSLENSLKNKEDLIKCVVNSLFAILVSSYAVSRAHANTHTHTHTCTPTYINIVCRSIEQHNQLLESSTVSALKSEIAQLEERMKREVKQQEIQQDELAKLRARYMVHFHKMYRTEQST